MRFTTSLYYFSIKIRYNSWGVNLSSSLRNKFVFLFTLAAATLVHVAPTTAPDAEVFRELGLYPITGNQLFPDILFVDQDGRNLRLSDFKGSVVLLNFWASWCPSCRAEMPSMERLFEELENSDFAMVPINVQESSELVEAFLEEYEIDFPVYYDLAGNAAREVGVMGLPTSVLIDREGFIKAAVAGGFDWNSKNLVSMMRRWTRKE